MRNTRIYHPETLSVGETVQLNDQATKHLTQVLRKNIDEQLDLFNGNNNLYQAQIVFVEKKKVVVKILNEKIQDIESPLKINLIQTISRAEKMDFTIQKSVELGVHEITPIYTERCGVKLIDEKRLNNKMRHWQQVNIAACEQSGRNYLPKLNSPLKLDQWLEIRENHTGLVMSPLAQQTLKQIKLEQKLIDLIIGPEGGLSQQEEDSLCQHGFQLINMGPRVLRTETAGLAGITALQTLFGDLN